jgi:hypothetical protein
MTVYYETPTANIYYTPTVNTKTTDLVEVTVNVSGDTPVLIPGLLVEFTAEVSAETPTTLTTFALNVEFTAKVDSSNVVPFVYIFFNIANFAVDNWTCSKNIADPIMNFSANIDQHSIPTYWNYLLLYMPGPDPADPPNEKDYCVFMGFIPGASFINKAANNKASINGFDNGWYLANQYIPSDQTVTVEATNPATTLKTLLGDDSCMQITGIDIFKGNIVDVSSWSSIQKSFMWKFDTKKRKAIDEMCDYTGQIFLLKPLQAGAGPYYPSGYFVDYADIDDADAGLDLPDIAVFTDPDDHVISIDVDVTEAEKVNRVRVHGTNRETGLWKTATEEHADVTSGSELPRELVIPDYIPEPPPADAAALQTAVDNKATELYALFHTNASVTKVRATLTRRGDLQLYQKVGFVGYSTVPGYSSPSTNVMRIINIEYRKTATEDIVTIECVLDKDLSNTLARRIALGKDTISGQQDIMADMLQGLGENEIGEVTAINGNVATVTLEKDGKVIEARILNP